MSKSNASEVDDRKREATFSVVIFSKENGGQKTEESLENAKNITFKISFEDKTIYLKVAEVHGLLMPDISVDKPEKVEDFLVLETRNVSPHQISRLVDSNKYNCEKYDAKEMNCRKWMSEFIRMVYEEEERPQPSLSVATKPSERSVASDMIFGWPGLCAAIGTVAWLGVGALLTSALSNPKRNRK